MVSSSQTMGNSFGTSDKILEGFEAYGIKYPPPGDKNLNNLKSRAESEHILDLPGKNRLCDHENCDTESVTSENSSLKDTERCPKCREWGVYPDNRERLNTSVDYPFENIVMSGGGSKGYAFMGSLQALEDCGILGKLRRVAGSSVGAVCAGLLAIGCSPQEIADVFAVDVKWLFQDQKLLPFYCIPNIWKKFGVHPANRFYKIYGNHIARKTGNADITFQQLYERTGIELCVVVTNLNRMCSEYCHPKTTPDIPVRLAVRMSMSFPVVYQPVQCEIRGVTSWYTDGGMLDQYPVHCFDGNLLELNHNEGMTDKMDGREFNKKTLGLYVVSETAMDYQIWKKLFGIEIPYKPTYVPHTRLARERLKDYFPKDRRNSYRKSLNCKTNSNSASLAASMENLHRWPQMEPEMKLKHFGHFIAATLEALLVNQRKHKVKGTDVMRTIPVNCGYIGTNDYDIDTGDREFMIRQGYQCTKRFLQDFNSQPTEVEMSQSSHPASVVPRLRIRSWNWQARVPSIETEV